MTTTARHSDRDEWCDMWAGAVGAYPTAFRVGIGYWSELASNASSYYADVLESLIAVWRHPEQAKAVLGDVQRGFREFLERSGETTERAVLDFNERFTATFRQSADRAPAAREAGAQHVIGTLRDLADLVSAEALKFQESQALPDLRAVREQVERLLRELRSVESDRPREPSAPPGP